MSTKLFYFSGTGNTMKLVKDLAAELGDATLVRISYDMDFDQSDCDCAGIAYPVYCFGLPNIVMNFIESVKFSKSAYVFGLASYGGMLTSAGHILRKKLRQKGYTLQAGFGIKMPGNATYVYDVPAEEKRNAMFDAQQARIKQIASVVKNRQSSKVETNYGILGKMMSGASAKMMSSIKQSDKNYAVDANCDACGICEKICPVNNLKLVGGKPQWSHNCEGCMACFHWCPKAAIQIGKKTAARSRYHHPDVQLKEMMS